MRLTLISANNNLSLLLAGEAHYFIHVCLLFKGVHEIAIAKFYLDTKSNKKSRQKKASPHKARADPPFCHPPCSYLPGKPFSLQGTLRENLWRRNYRYVCFFRVFRRCGYY
ncbi:hypothetical protein MUGA111182_08750 [Mucilaginibacter galii]